MDSGDADGDGDDIVLGAAYVPWACGTGIWIVRDSTAKPANLDTRK